MLCVYVCVNEIVYLHWQWIVSNNRYKSHFTFHLILLFCYWPLDAIPWNVINQKIGSAWWPHVLYVLWITSFERRIILFLFSFSACRLWSTYWIIEESRFMRRMWRKWIIMYSTNLSMGHRNNVIMFGYMRWR